MSNDNTNPLDALTSEELNLYLKGRPTDPDAVKLRERVAKEFERIHGTEEVSLTPTSVHAQEPVSKDYEYVVYRPNDEPTIARSFIAAEMRKHGLDAGDMKDLKKFLTIENIDEMKFDVMRLEELSQNDDYNTQGSLTNERAKKVIARMDMAMRGLILRKTGRNIS